MIDSIPRMYLIPDLGKLYCCEEHTNKVLVIDPQTGEHTQTLSGHTGFVTAVVRVPMYQVIVTASLDATLSVWNEETGACIYFTSTVTEDVSTLYFSSSSFTHLLQSSLLVLSCI